MLGFLLRLILNFVSIGFILFLLLMAIYLVFFVGETNPWGAFFGVVLGVSLLTTLMSE